MTAAKRRRLLASGVGAIGVLFVAVRLLTPQADGDAVGALQAAGGRAPAVLADVVADSMVRADASSPAARARDTTRIEGAVLQPDGAPARDRFRIRVYRGAKALQWIETAGDGSFEVEVGRGRHKLRLQPARGWALVEGTVTFRRDVDGPVALVVRAETPLPIRAEIVDVETGEPLPDFAVRFRQGAVREEARTAADGVLLTKRAYGSGAYEVEWIDDASVTRYRGPYGPSLRPTAESGAVDFHDVRLRVATGPTYALEPEPWQPELVAGLVPVDHTFEPSSKVWLQAVRPGPLPWVRLGVTLDGNPFRVSGEWKLGVATPDLGLYGEASVPSVRGIWAEPIRVTLEPRCVLRCATNCRSVVEVVSADASIRRAADATSARPASFLLPHGAYTVVASAPGKERDERRVELASSTETVAFHLARKPGEIVSGVVSSESGTYAARTEVMLRPVGHADDERVARVAWHDTEEGVAGRFLFEDVPVGQYVVEVASFLEPGGEVRLDWRGNLLPSNPRDYVEWKPHRQIVAAPDTSLRLRCLDTTERADLIVVARDSGSTAPARGLVAFVRPEGEGWHRVEPAMDSGQPLARRYPLRRRLDWAVIRPGFLPVRGTLSSFHEVGRQRRADVALEPGWGCAVRVVDATGEPVPGARIEAGSETLGTTDDTGFAVIGTTVRPEQVTVAADGVGPVVVSPGAQVALDVTL